MQSFGMDAGTFPSPQLLYSLPAQVAKLIKTA